MLILIGYKWKKQTKFINSILNEYKKIIIKTLNEPALDNSFILHVNSLDDLILIAVQRIIWVLFYYNYLKLL